MKTAKKKLTNNETAVYVALKSSHKLGKPHATLDELSDASGVKNLTTVRSTVDSLCKRGYLVWPVRPGATNRTIRDIQIQAGA